MAPSRRAVIAAMAALAASAACGSTGPAAARRTKPDASGPPTSGPPTSGPTTSGPTPATVPTPPAPTGPARETDAGSRARPLVALTFHGQGDPSLTAALLAEAERGGARLTVFAVGSWLAANPATAHRIQAGGHELGNHTQRHLPMAGMGEAQAYDEFARCADVLRRLTGSPGVWARPSGTPHTTAALRAAAGRAGYRVCVGYDIDSLDYTDPGAPVVRRRTAAAQAGSIVSLHLGHPGTVAALPAILADLRGKGLQPVTLTTLLGTA